MNEMRNNLIAEKKESKISLPFVVALVGILFMIVALFLPYMTAVGDMAEYIENHPDRMEIESIEIKAGDLLNIPIASVSNIITGVYGEDDGAIANVIVFVLVALLAFTALFVILKKPIVIIIFNLLACGVFSFLNSTMKEDFIAANKYAWGIGFYTMIVATVATFVGAIWLLVTKINYRKEVPQTEIN